MTKTKGLLIMDVDSTLIQEEGIDLLGEIAGSGAEIADITSRAMNGELDFAEALAARVGLLKGLPETVFSEKDYLKQSFLRCASKFILLKVRVT